MEEEQLIWKGSPSQWVNFKVYFRCFLFIAIAILFYITLWDRIPVQWTNFKIFIRSLLIIWLASPIFTALWKYYVVKTKRIKITNQRIIEEKGIFSRTTDELELYRVKDIRLHEPFFYRLLGISTITLATSDKSDPILNIKAIRKGKEIREKLRLAVDIRRDVKGVREADLE